MIPLSTNLTDLAPFPLDLTRYTSQSPLDLPVEKVEFTEFRSSLYLLTNHSLICFPFPPTFSLSPACLSHFDFKLGWAHTDRELFSSTTHHHQIPSMDQQCIFLTWHLRPTRPAKPYHGTSEFISFHFFHNKVSLTFHLTSWFDMDGYIDCHVEC